MYSAGFGALGLGRDVLESQLVRRIESLEGQGITRIRAGYGGALAVRGELFHSQCRSRDDCILRYSIIDAGDETAIFSWGLNNHDGRLGVGNLSAEATPAQTATSFDPTPADKRSLRGIRDSSISRIPMHVHTPTELPMPLSEIGLGDERGARWMIGEFEIGEEAMWVEIVQEAAPEAAGQE